MANRESQWTEQQDQILAQTILSYIENNGTQLEGFQAAAQLLQRTPAACGFRWNKEVRKNFLEQLEKAKERKVEIKGIRPNIVVKESLTAAASDDVITQASQLIELLVAENKELKIQLAKRDNEINLLTGVLQKARESIGFSEVSLKTRRKVSEI